MKKHILTYLLAFTTTVLFAEDVIIKYDNATCIKSEVTNGKLIIVWKQLNIDDMGGRTFHIVDNKVVP